MTTSGETSYNPVMSKVLYRALRMVGGFASTDKPRTEQIDDALDILNAMLKEWQTDGFLWLKSFFQMDLVAGQYYYPLGPAGTAEFWPALTTKIDRPTRVWSLNRLLSTGYEIPLNPISRDEYQRLPSKTTPGSVVQYYYDPQMANGVLYVWPCPQVGTTDKIRGTCDRTIQDMINSDVTFDLPVEWADAMAFCLAERLWFEYPTTGTDYQLLAIRAKSGRDFILSYDRENANTQIEIGR